MLAEQLIGTVLDIEVDHTDNNRPGACLLLAVKTGAESCVDIPDSEDQSVRWQSLFYILDLPSHLAAASGWSPPHLQPSGQQYRLGSGQLTQHQLFYKRFFINKHQRYFQIRNLHLWSFLGNDTKLEKKIVENSTLRV